MKDTCIRKQLLTEICWTWQNRMQWLAVKRKLQQWDTESVLTGYTFVHSRRRTKRNFLANTKARGHYSRRSKQISENGMYMECSAVCLSCPMWWNFLISLLYLNTGFQQIAYQFYMKILLSKKTFFVLHDLDKRPKITSYIIRGGIAFLFRMSSEFYAREVKIVIERVIRIEICFNTNKLFNIACILPSTNLPYEEYKRVMQDVVDL